MWDGASGTVVAVSRSDGHSFTKAVHLSIHVRTGLGVDHDAHQGAKVKHRSRVKRDPTQDNLRQVHLLHGELFAELREQGFLVGPGDVGENITTQGVPLLELPRGTRLHIGPSAVVELTGLRNPCSQLDDFQLGLMSAVLERAPDGTLRRKVGVMSVVVADGEIRAGDAIDVELPATPHEPLPVV